MLAVGHDAALFAAGSSKRSSMRSLRPRKRGGQQVLVGHQLRLEREPVQGGALADRLHLGGARRGVGMIDVVLRPVAAPARRELHAPDVERFVGESGQRVVIALPRCQRALEPLGVVAPRIVLAGMRAAALGAGERAVGDRERDLEHLLDPVARHELRVGPGRLVAQPDVAAPDEQLLQLVDGLLEVLAGAEDADLRGHDLLHRHAQDGRVLRALAREHRVELGLLAVEKLLHQPHRHAGRVLRPVAEVGDVLADDHPGDDGLGDRVAAQPVEAVHVPARGLARGEQALEGRALAGVVGADAAHGVVLGRAHRDRAP